VLPALDIQAISAHPEHLNVSMVVNSGPVARRNHDATISPAQAFLYSSQLVIDELRGEHDYATFRTASRKP
jgi:hypothetical protein